MFFCDLLNDSHVQQEEVVKSVSTAQYDTQLFRALEQRGGKNVPPTDAQIITDMFESQDVNCLDTLCQQLPLF